MYCIGFISWLVFDCVLHWFSRFVRLILYCMGVIVLFVFDCVLHRCCRVVSSSWCIAVVVAFGGYLIVYCIGVIVLFVVDCVLQ